MRNPCACLVLVLVLMCPDAPAQEEQADSLGRESLSPRLPLFVVDTALVRSTSATTRYLNSYDAMGRRVSGVTQVFHGDEWANWLRETSTYDSSGNRLSELYESWANGQWADGYLITYTYDANGNMLSQSSGTWHNTYTYTYDVSGNILTVLYEGWSSGQSMSSARDTYTYDAGGLRLTELWERWSNGQWVNFGRGTYTRNAIGAPLSYLAEDWSAGQWVTSWHAAYTYDSSGRILDWSRYFQSGDSLAERVQYIYDVNGNIVTRDMLSRWGDHLLLKTYTFDGSGRRLSCMQEQPGTEPWRTTYFYDSNGCLTSWWRHAWHNSSWVPTEAPEAPKLLGIIRPQPPDIHDSTGISPYFDGYNVEFKYKTILLSGVASQSENMPSNFTLSQNYPNPFNPVSTIGFSIAESRLVTLRVYDILGREVAVLVNEKKVPGNYEVKFDGSNLASGVYFYRLEAVGFTNVKKSVLLK
jgi:hypothetical protein